MGCKFLPLFFGIHNQQRHQEPSDAEFQKRVVEDSDTSDHEDDDESVISVFSGCFSWGNCVWACHISFKRWGLWKSFQENRKIWRFRWVLVAVILSLHQNIAWETDSFQMLCMM